MTDGVTGGHTAIWMDWSSHRWTCGRRHGRVLRVLLFRAEEGWKVRAMDAKGHVTVRFAIETVEWKTAVKPVSIGESACCCNRAVG